MPHARAALSDILAGLFRLAPAPAPRWPLALQAAAAMVTPIVVFTLLGHPEMGYRTAAGAFIVIHASALPAVERARVLPVVGAGLLGAAALGIVCAGSPALALAGLVVVALVAAAGMYGFALGAPGPIFFVLVYGLSGQISANLDAAGSLTYLGTIVLGMTFAYLLTLIPLLWPRRRRVSARSLRQLLPGPSLSGVPGTMFLRAAIVTVAGTVIGAFVDPQRTYWVVGAALGVVGVAVGRRLAVARGLHRMLGTVAGAGVFLLIAPWGLEGLWLAATLGALQIVVELLVVRNYGLALVFITPLVLLLTGAATGQLGTDFVGERVIDTLVGGALGAASGFLHRPGHGALPLHRH
ncbi:FUSC family protein [Microbacterium sp. Sa4CUA7]|uniref:FUSC family protein n=1 Tax=Microbacterium pullorum TaxID=2762236 RepID=A0ABR8S5K7_9MICO|nr:FUSC family protein [Microbacterium pullorum]MBD7958772.1 FUSC family protein [Microbacterium pullorum]